MKYKIKEVINDDFMIESICDILLTQKNYEVGDTVYKVSQYSKCKKCKIIEVSDLSYKVELNHNRSFILKSGIINKDKSLSLLIGTMKLY